MLDGVNKIMKKEDWLSTAKWTDKNKLTITVGHDVLGLMPGDTITLDVHIYNEGERVSIYPGKRGHSIKGIIK